MRLEIAGRPHLTYCTNIHPGETWPEVRRNLERYVLHVKENIAPSEPFGLGLRLSAGAAEALCHQEELEAFRGFLDAYNLYVFTINGFPYGAFHGTRVKEQVYLPDWRDEERLTYTDNLAYLLARLLPPDPKVTGSISTIPGAFKPWIRSDEDIKRMVEIIVRHAATLHRLHETTGRVITLALEPEPHCFLETIAETVLFFRDRLFEASAVDACSRLTGLSRPDSEQALRRHLGVCFDTCHAAVEFEDPVQSVEALRSAGIQIAKAQLSAGLRIPKLTPLALDALHAFNEEIYLHQVVERCNGVQASYLDLPDALSDLRGNVKPNCEWRVHFHVPIFLKNMGTFENTQDFLDRILAIQADNPFTDHLEVETYTWEVLPKGYLDMDIVSAITRELTWVIERMTK